MAQKGNRQRQNGKNNGNHDILGVSLVVISLFLLLCIVIPPILSVVSKAIFNVILGVVGIMAYPILIAMFLLGVCMLLRRTLYMSKKKVICTVFIAFFGLIILQLASTHAFLDETYSQYIADIYAAKYSAGGVIFGTIAFGLKTAITEVGCYIVFSIGVIVSIVVMTDLVGRIRARHSSVSPADIAPAAPVTRGFNSKTEPQRVVQVEPQNKLYVGQIEKKVAPKISTESGKTTDMVRAEPRVVTDYSPSPIIERFNTFESAEEENSPAAARYALYGDSDAINERAKEEFTQKETVIEPPKKTETVEPYVRVSEDAYATQKNKPKKIDHDESPDMELFFPTPKKTEFNDKNDIISADELRAHLAADIKKLRREDIENAEADNAPPPLFVIPDLKSDFDTPQPEIPSFTSRADDIFDAPTDKKEDEYRTAEERFLSERESEREKNKAEDQGEIIDAFAMRKMYSDESEQTAAPVSDGGIINGTPTVGRSEEQKLPPRSDIIDATAPYKSEPRAAVYEDPDDGITDALKISDEPAIDLSEKHDITSDMIDGGESSGMYVPATEEPIQESVKPKRSKSSPIDNQITIDSVLRAQADESVVINEAARRKKYNYAPPPIDLLKIYEKPDQSMDELQSTAETLERVIKGFLKADVKVINIVPGPTVTRYELDIPTGVPVKQIETRSQDIEYELATPSHIRIEAPIPGKRAVGIEIPNVNKSIVGLREMIESSEFQRAKSPLTVSIGKDISGGTVLCDLVKVPHLLIAGQTGSGKSACLNGLIISLLYKSSPEDLRFILVDPKRVEFSAYSSMPHLLFDGIIYEPNEVLNALKWACSEMERRYALMAKYGRNQLATFNELPDVQSGKIDKLPQIIIIIDELADIMQSVVKRDIEDRIKVIAAKARAAGIHLIVATQRPSADVITGTIKTNLTSRIAFKVSDQSNSRIILDEQGAEALVGNGDMLFYPVDYSSPKRVQGSFIRDEEVASVITYIKEHFETDFDESAYNYVFSSDKSGNGGMGGGDGGSKDDPLLPDVLALIIKTGQASTSGIQRRFSIGYARAARIIDSMEELGYIGPNTGTSKPRDVYITPDKYRELYGRDVEEN